MTDPTPARRAPITAEGLAQLRDPDVRAALRKDLPERLRLRWLVLAVAAGTAVRVAWALWTNGWLAAPEQLAWELLLRESESGLRLDQLVTVPHEAGSGLLSLLALALTPFAELPRLSWIALGIDAASRVVQIAVVDRALGKRAAAWFAAWSVVGVPALLLAATRFESLHAVSAVWPFLLLLLAMRSDRTARGATLLGVLAGIAAAWSAVNLAIFPALAAAVALWPGAAGRRAALLRAGAGLLAVAGAAGAARLALDLGWTAQAGSARLALGLPPAGPGTDLAAWAGTIPQAMLLPALGPPGLIVLAWLAALGGGIATALLYVGKERRFAALALLTALTFAAIDAVVSGPIAEPARWAYVLPLLAAVGLYGLGRSRLTWPIAGALVALSLASAATRFMGAREPTAAALTPAGRLLGQKLAHDRERLKRLLVYAPAWQRPELAHGFGWGLARALLSPPGGEHRLEDLLAAIRGYEELALADHVEEGALRAFDGGEATALDPALREALVFKLHGGK